MALSLGNLRLEVLDELVALFVHKPEMERGDGGEPKKRECIRMYVLSCLTNSAQLRFCAIGTSFLCWVH